MTTRKDLEDQENLEKLQILRDLELLLSIVVPYNFVSSTIPTATWMALKTWLT